MKIAHSDDVLLTRPVLEVWVPRAALETIVCAAAAYRDFVCDDDDLISAIDDAIKIIQDAVDDDMQPPLNEHPLV